MKKSMNTTKHLSIYATPKKIVVVIKELQEEQKIEKQVKKVEKVNNLNEVFLNDQIKKIRSNWSKNW